MVTNNLKKNYSFVKYGLGIIFVTAGIVFLSLALLKTGNTSILQRIINYFINPLAELI